MFLFTDGAVFQASNTCAVRSLLGIRLEGPIAVAENRHALSVCFDAVDIQVFGADHEIDVRGAFVDASLKQLLGAHLQASFVAVGETLAERKMAAGVFVEERAVEKHAGIANGAVEGDESYFAQAAGVLVGLHDGAQNVFACSACRQPRGRL